MVLRMKCLSRSSRSVAFLHRYGLAGWICCGGHSIPRMLEILREQGIEVHFFGPRSTDTIPEGADTGLRLHTLPFTWDRANPMHKWTRTLLWYLHLPFVCLYCRLKRIGVMAHVDETLPLSGWVIRLCFGRRFALTVMDFFARIYTERHLCLRPLGRTVEWLDLQIWKRTPVLFTKVLHTQAFLKDAGIPDTRIFLARNPCDHRIFFPMDDAARAAARARYGFSAEDLVLSHHGIMHPNKGNDWIVERVSELLPDIPNLAFLLIGDGPDMARIKRLVQRRGLQQRVILTGWAPTEADLNAGLNAADIGLAMRIGQETDHFHMTDALSHEMACGKPVLAARLKGMMEIARDGENAILFDPDKPDEFRRAVRRLAADPALRRTLGQAALATSRAVSDIEVCAHQVADPIADLVREGGTSPR